MKRIKPLVSSENLELCCVFLMTSFPETLVFRAFWLTLILVPQERGGKDESQEDLEAKPLLDGG